MDDTEAKRAIQERYAELPKEVQEAITDASVEKKLRALAQKHRLHLDQWVLLENEIMLTLLGLEEAENMEKNVMREVHVDQETARAIVNDIALQVFNPIREQLRSELPKQAVEEPKQRQTPDNVESMVPTARSVKEDEETAGGVPAEKKEEKKAPSDSAAYKPGQRSTERRDVAEDPYRESIE